MEAIELRAEQRTVTGKKVKHLRSNDIVPGIIYGRRIDPLAVQFDYRDLNYALNMAGTSTAIQVYVQGQEEPYLAIFRDVQHHPIRRQIRHVDLQALSLDETVQVPVTVLIVGTAPATEEAGGVLVQLLNELNIEALPTALIPAIEVDVSGLTEIGDSITVEDITPPEGVTILNALDETIVQVSFMAEETFEEEVELEPLEGELGVLGEAGELEVEGEEGELEEMEMEEPEE
jgi:large subunit ribosomal protein L25